MSSSELLESPAASIQEEHLATLALVTLLTQEQNLLAEAGIDNLTDIISNKATLVSKMTQLAHRRYQALGAAGYDESEAGMQAWLDDAGDADARALRDKTLEVAAAANELNRLNGLLIGKYLAINQNAIEILQGKTLQPSAARFYGPDGQSSLQPTGRTLGIG